MIGGEGCPPLAICRELFDRRQARAFPGERSAFPATAALARGQAIQGRVAADAAHECCALGQLANHLSRGVLPVGADSKEHFRQGTNGLFYHVGGELPPGAEGMTGA